MCHTLPALGKAPWSMMNMHRLFKILRHSILFFHQGPEGSFFVLLVRWNVILQILGFFYHETTSSNVVFTNVFRWFDGKLRYNAVPCSGLASSFLNFLVNNTLSVIIKVTHWNPWFCFPNLGDWFSQTLPCWRFLHLVEAKIHFSDLIRTTSKLSGPILAFFCYLSVFFIFTAFTWRTLGAAFFPLRVWDPILKLVLGNFLLKR